MPDADAPARRLIRLRRRAGGKVMNLLIRGASGAGRLHPRARLSRHGLELIRDVPYLDAGGRAHLLDVVRPRERSGPLPAVLYVHGGGFRICSKETHWMMALVYARRGHVVFNINYRLAPRHPFPAAIADACAAYRWVARNARRYGADPRRLVLAGESAGANLVTALTIAACYPRPERWARGVHATGVTPAAVVPACGILQVSDARRLFARNPTLSPLLRDRILDTVEAYLPEPGDELDPRALADPLPFLEQAGPPARPLPPFFIPCGTADPLLDDSRRLAAALRRLGVPCEAPAYEGGIHAFHALLWQELAQRCWRDTFAFLRSHLPPPG